MHNIKREYNENENILFFYFFGANNVTDTVIIMFLEFSTNNINISFILRIILINFFVRDDEVRVVHEKQAE